MSVPKVIIQCMLAKDQTVVSYPGVRNVYMGDKIVRADKYRVSTCTTSKEFNWSG